MTNQINMENIGSVLQAASGYLATGTGHLGNIAAGAGAVTVTVNALTELVDTCRSNPEKAKYDELTKSAERSAKSNEEYMKQLQKEFDEILKRDNKLDEMHNAKLEQLRAEHTAKLELKEQIAAYSTKIYNEKIREMDEQLKNELASRKQISNEEKKAIEDQYEKLKIEAKNNYETEIKETEAKRKDLEDKHAVAVKEIEKDINESRDARMRKEADHAKEMKKKADEFHDEKIKAIEDMRKLREKIMADERKVQEDFTNEKLMKIRTNYTRLCATYQDRKNRELLYLVLSDLMEPAGRISALLEDVDNHIEFLKEEYTTLDKESCQISTKSIEDYSSTIKANLSRIERHLINNPESNSLLRKNVKSLMRSIEESIKKARDTVKLRRALQLNNLTSLEVIREKLEVARISFDNDIKNYQKVDSDQFITNFENSAGLEGTTQRQVEGQNPTQEVVTA